eukprot:CAMPEP_0170172430 /NCGR_PEP_ID=MMETSP0040_2-20121228/5657_1 /TAXON_ID=641309 /ORGANISM="Lotharella oceanica, Strain CCMP622" /LENGTH=74 /DNA_ID=CAMNT_0010413079 /DNA_START=1075 /DNA_END=1299 /DNA_ORIENTATION=+
MAFDERGITVVPILGHVVHPRNFFAVLAAAATTADAAAGGDGCGAAGGIAAGRVQHHHCLFVCPPHNDTCEIIQ